MATTTPNQQLAEFGDYLRPVTEFNLLFAAQLVAAILYGQLFEVPINSFRRCRFAAATKLLEAALFVTLAVLCIDE